jgi:hypothetical protein
MDGGIAGRYAQSKAPQYGAAIWSSNMEKNNIDIRALTTEAEQGHGSAIQKALQDLSWEDGLKVAKQIAAQNKADVSNNPILPTVSLSTDTFNSGTSGILFSGMTSTDAKFTLEWAPQGQREGLTLYADTVSIKSYDLDKKK